MKTLTLVCNFVLLGIIGLSIISGGLPGNDKSALLMLLGFLVTTSNIILIAGSDIHPRWFGRFADRQIKKGWSAFGIIKFFAISLNLLVMGLLYHDYQSGGIRGQGVMFMLIMIFLVSTPLFSIIRISAGRWTRFEGIRRTLLYTGLSFTVLVLGVFITLRIMIGHGIRENISIAKKEYPGKAEDALLAYLADSTRSPYERSHVAIWTLGQLRSRKALPVLQKLYKNDPEGRICKGNHNTELCQYEIHKAIVLIENSWQGDKEKNRFGSWARLNE